MCRLCSNDTTIKVTEINRYLSLSHRLYRLAAKFRKVAAGEILPHTQEMSELRVETKIIEECMRLEDLPTLQELIENSTEIKEIRDNNVQR